MSVFGSYSRYYNLLYQDKDYAGEAAYVSNLIGKHYSGASSILDLGCGTGKHCILLAEEGFEVTGVDKSTEMLDVANTHLAHLNPHPSSLKFIQADIRSVRLDSSFDAVISLFHVMCYQTTNDDMAAVFATAKSHLKPGGIFIFDCWYGPAVLTDRPTVRIKRLKDAEIALTRIVEPVMYPNQNHLELNFNVLARNIKSGTVEEVQEKHLMRYFFRPEIEFLVQKFDMSILEVAEWMTGREPGFDTWGVCFVIKR